MNDPRDRTEILKSSGFTTLAGAPSNIICYTPAFTAIVMSLQALLGSDLLYRTGDSPPHFPFGTCIQESRMRDALLRLAFLMLVACSLNVAAGPVWKKGVTLPVVVEGSACNSASDKIGMSSSNVVLSCQSSVWLGQTKIRPSQIVYGAFVCTAGQTTYAACPAGTTLMSGTLVTNNGGATSIYPQSQAIGNGWNGTILSTGGCWQAQALCLPQR